MRRFAAGPNGGAGPAASQSARGFDADESAHADADLEWWFIHGRFAGAEVEERHFMASIFRYRAHPMLRRVSAFAALLSVLDPRTGRHSSCCRVDGQALGAIKLPGIARRIDPFSPPTTLDELRRYGLPREFQCPDAAPVLSANPLCFEWGDLGLASRAGGVVLAFHEPGTARPLRLDLSIDAPRLEIEAARSIGEPAQAMRYITYPGMRLSGSAGGLAVEGEAWFDHQWGGLSHVQSQDSPPRIRGWDWLGCRLDDGSVWVAVTHWDGRSGDEFARHLTLRDRSGAVHVSRSFEMRPVRWWTSPATRIRHPVEWSLRVPEWDVDLAFVPLADNQEVRMLGPLRAIWEGAGRVRGSVRGRPVEGPARLEGQGRGCVFSASAYLGGWTGPVDRELAAFLPREVRESDIRRYAGPAAWVHEPSSYTSTLAGPWWDLMSRGEKRWRAAFFYLLLEALGRDPEPLRDLVFVLPELPHNASLIIDDIQDGSTIRRGTETTHRYGLDVAISAANNAYFLPLLVVLDHRVLTEEEKQGICAHYHRALVRAHLGQSLDLFWTHGLNRKQIDGWMNDSIGPKILQTYAFKTAALVEAISESAVLLARAGDGTRSAVLEFARSFGLAFQYIDDVNNFSDAPALGKERGEDLRAGKLTYLILRALERLPTARRNLLSDILCRPDLRQDPDALQRGIEMVVSSGACEDLRREARDSAARGWAALSRVVPPSCPKTELRYLWESLLESSPVGAKERRPSRT